MCHTKNFVQLEYKVLSVVRYLAFPRKFRLQCWQSTRPSGVVSCFQAILLNSELFQTWRLGSSQGAFGYFRPDTDTFPQHRRPVPGLWEWLRVSKRNGWLRCFTVCLGGTVPWQARINAATLFVLNSRMMCCVCMSL